MEIVWRSRFLSRAQSFSRGLSYLLTRVLICGDLALGTLNPLWGWWLYKRWTTKEISWPIYWPIYKRWLAIAWKHFRHGQSHTGLWSTAWCSPPVRHTRHEERIDYRPKGSCGTCSNCCKTSWLPPAEQVACPFLDNNKCTIYGGLFWDHFNCGRFPAAEPELHVYKCPRFVTGSLIGAIEIRSDMPTVPECQTWSYSFRGGVTAESDSSVRGGAQDVSSNG